MGGGDAEVALGGGDVHEFGGGEFGGEFDVEAGVAAAVGDVAGGAVGVQVGADAEFDGYFGVVGIDEAREFGGLFVQGLGEEADVFEGTELIVVDAIVVVVAVHLHGGEAEDVLGGAGVADHAFGTAGVVPGL